MMVVAKGEEDMAVEEEQVEEKMRRTVRWGKDLRCR